jgi:hypothetical protein
MMEVMVYTDNGGDGEKTWGCENDFRLFMGMRFGFMIANVEYR